MRLAEIMTTGVVTAGTETSAVEVARLMRDHRVGSVVVVDRTGGPVAMVTDRDLALRVFAEGASPDSAVIEHASRPLEVMRVAAAGLLPGGVRVALATDRGLPERSS